MKKNIIRELCLSQDLVIGILGGEEERRREFVGFLREYEKR